MDRSNYKGYRRAPQAARAEPMFPKTPAGPQPAAADKAVRKRVLRTKRKYLRPLVALIIVALLVFFAYEYAHTKNQLEKLSNPKTANESATQQLIDKVGKLSVLPKNETPTLFTINNVSTLRSQSAFAKYFYANAQDGDKLLVYTKSNIAFIYRPSINKIVGSGPYDIAKIVQQSTSGH